MASNLRVDTILPSSGLTLGIGTANGTINFLGDTDISTTGSVLIAGNLGVGGTVTYEDVARIDATGLSTFREGYKVGPLTGIALTAYKDGSIRTTGIITASSFVGSGANLTGVGVDGIVSSADATAITINSSELVGIGTDQIGGKLEVYNTDSKINALTVRTGAGIGGYAGLSFASNRTHGREKAAIYFQETGGTGHGTGSIVFAVNNVPGGAGQVSTSDERLRIDSVGNVKISGIVTATSFVGSGANLTGIAGDGEFKGWVVYDSAAAHTWSKPAGLKRIKVYVTGGGGGGGGHNAGKSGCGGTAGGTAVKVIEAGALGSTETATVGAGGAGGDPGGAGSSSSFGSHCSATGGTGGATDGGGSNYMNGGIGSGGDLNIRGQGSSADSTIDMGSNGGSSHWGGGGGGGINYGRPHGGSGTYGSGGGGGYQTGAGAAGNGGNGGIGLIVVEQYF